MGCLYNLIPEKRDKDTCTGVGFRSCAGYDRSGVFSDWGSFLRGSLELQGLGVWGLIKGLRGFRNAGRTSHVHICAHTMSMLASEYKSNPFIATRRHPTVNVCLPETQMGSHSLNPISPQARSIVYEGFPKLGIPFGWSHNED